MYMILNIIIHTKYLNVYKKHVLSAHYPYIPKASVFNIKITGGQNTLKQ